MEAFSQNSNFSSLCHSLTVCLDFADFVKYHIYLVKLGNISCHFPTRTPHWLTAGHQTPADNHSRACIQIRYEDNTLLIHIQKNVTVILLLDNI